MSDIAIHVEHLGKQYHIGQKVRYLTFRDAITKTLYSPIDWVKKSIYNDNNSIPDLFWALKDITLDVYKGEAIGIIGRNGAGKSTLLKILSKITEPTEGYAEIYGRVGSLLEVGTGFHPELTGRENVYLSGAILGMRKSEIEHNFDEIVKFAEVEKFLDLPLKNYSSGMQVRLAFSVAAFLQPEILMVDEVLAVGDLAFQKKCLGKMSDISKNEKRTIFFVSHNMAAVENLCSRAILIDNGKLISDGTPIDIISQYMEILSSNTSRNINETGPVYFENIVLISDNQKNGQLRPWSPCCIKVTFNTTIRLKKCYINLHIDDVQGRHCIHLRTDFDNLYPEFNPGRHSILINISSLNLEGGAYVALVRLVTEKQNIILDSDKIFINIIREYERFEAIGANVAVKHSWDIM